MKHGHPDPIQLTLLHQRMKSYCGSNRNNSNSRRFANFFLLLLCSFCHFLCAPSSPTKSVLVFVLSAFTVIIIIIHHQVKRHRPDILFHHHYSLTHSLSVLSLFDRIVTLCSVCACACVCRRFCFHCIESFICLSFARCISSCLEIRLRCLSSPLDDY